MFHRVNFSALVVATMAYTIDPPGNIPFCLSQGILGRNEVFSF